MTLEKLREELVKDIIEALDEHVVWPDISGTKVPNLVTQIIVDSFDEYEFTLNKVVDIDQMKIEIEDVASYLEDVNKEEEVMSNVLDRHDSDPFETMGEVYAYLDGLLQKY